MKTLIELYDERPIENVLSTEIFLPDRTVYICAQEVAEDTALQKRLREYYRRRKVDVELIFLGTSVLDAISVRKRILSVLERYPDCALDIAGGTDAALFAAGMVASERKIPVFTYSRKRNMYFSIKDAPFAHHLPCHVQLGIEDCFLMAGGIVRQGRVDNSILERYMGDIDAFFSLYLRHRQGWTSVVTWFQRVSRQAPGEEAPLDVDAKYVQTGDYGSAVPANEEALRELEDIGFLQDLEIRSGKSVRFRFRNGQIRTWLRDVGSVLELAIYKACLDVGCYQEVRTSVVVDWDGRRVDNDVSNEIDVVATSGVIPVFISCKTGDVRTEALNELAILRDRFGGAMARAAIVTCTRGGAAMRNRAAELAIEVIDLNDLIDDSYKDRLKAILSNRL